MEISLTLISPSDTSSSLLMRLKCKNQFPHDAEEKFSSLNVGQNELKRAASAS